MQGFARKEVGSAWIGGLVMNDDGGVMWRQQQVER